MEDLDDASYVRYCGPAILNKSLHTLQGILAGINLDGEINNQEISELRSWCEEHLGYKRINPFNEIIETIDEALTDGAIDNEELKDIYWFVNKALDNSSFYSASTAKIQELQGILHGILADRKISHDEANNLMSWIEENDYLSGTYPYDEIYGILLETLKDGKLDADESELLKAFFSQFAPLSTNNEIALSKEVKHKISALGVCAVDPTITFQGKVFTFTGHSLKGSRTKLAEIVERFGGIHKKRPTKDISYLVYGVGGNQCWSYACYGRKIEQVISMRKAGSKALIVHENDFWDAYEFANSS